MSRFVFYLALLGGLAYGGLYFYYGVAVKQRVTQELDALGFTALQVERVEHGPLAPLSMDAKVSTTVTYRGAEASVDVRVIGHPVFSDEFRLELDSLRALRLTLGSGGER
ncbi:hypothetical protein [Halomonas sp. C05BenzN]|uniref:hypothetical protein n=1 Tax=Halomonas sp. C05BenzN TaxID=3411041 RepID=UPI003B94E7B4